MCMYKNKRGPFTPSHRCLSNTGKTFKIMKRQDFVLQMTHDVVMKELGNLPFEDVIEQVLDMTDNLETEYRRRYKENLFNN